MEETHEETIYGRADHSDSAGNRENGLPGTGAGLIFAAVTELWLKLPGTIYPCKDKTQRPDGVETVSTGNPSIRHSGSPPSRRLALIPCSRNLATASNARTQCGPRQ